MEHLGDELYLRRLGRVLLCEVQPQLEQTAFPYCAFRALNERRPVQQIALLRRRIDSLILFFAQLGEVSDQPFLSCSSHYLYNKY